MLRTTWISVTMLAISCMYASLRADDSAIKQENTEENLKALCEKLQRALARQDSKTFNELGFGFAPDESRLKRGLRDNLAPADLKAIVAMHTSSKHGASGNASKLFMIRPEQSQVLVHASTTEELAAYAPGSTAHQHFPGGCKTLALKVLKPGTSYYEAEFRKPGDQAGVKFHLFYWDGKQWSMLGPVWRVIK